jgi:hypothetical protein
MYKEIKDIFLKSGYMMDFLGQKKNENKLKYINLILRTYLGKENNELNYENNNDQFLGLYKYNSSSNNVNNFSFSEQNNDEEKEIKNKIKNFGDFLEIYPYNFNIIIQIHDLIDNYFSDDVIINKENIDLKNYELFIEKIIYFGENLFLKYLCFIMNYFILDFLSPEFNDISYIKLKEILENINYIVNNVDNKCLLKNSENCLQMQENIIDFYKNLVLEILKKKISKKIKKYILLKRKNKIKDKEVKILKENLKTFFDIVNLCKEIITGEKLIDINNETFEDILLTKDFILYIKNLN